MFLFFGPSIKLRQLFVLAEYLSVRVYPTNMFPVLGSDRIPKEIDLICFGNTGVSGPIVRLSRPRTAVVRARVHFQQ